MKNQISHYEDKLKYEIDSSDLFAKISINENIVVIDTRSKELFEIEHIPGSVNIPHRNMDVNSTSEIDHEALCITYCDGIGCNGSTKGTLNMAKLGFKVKELMGGLDWWKKDGYETEGTKGSPTKDKQCGC